MTSTDGSLVKSQAFTVNVVDTTAPTLHASTVPGMALTGGGDSVGDTIVLTVTFDGNVNGLSSGTDSTIFKVAGTGVDASWSGTAGTSTRTLTYTVQAGQSGLATLDEAALKASLVAGISDAAGNAFSYSLNGGSIANIDSTALPTVDGAAPTATLTTGVSSNTASATVQSSETGTAYLVKTGGTGAVTVTNLASITGAADAKWNASSITAANTPTALSLSNLEDGTYSLYTVDAAGNLSAAAQPNVSSYRYVMMATSSYGWVIASELKVMSGGTDVAQGKVFSSNLDQARSLLDNNLFTTWGSNQGNNGTPIDTWAEWDLGAATGINSIIISPEQNNAQNFAGARLFVSNQSMKGFTVAQLTAGHAGAVYVGQPVSTANGKNGAQTLMVPSTAATFTVDTAVGSLVGITPTLNGLSGATATETNLSGGFTVTVNASNVTAGDVVELLLNGAPLETRVFSDPRTANGSVTITLPNSLQMALLADGTHTLSARLVDAAGNAGAASNAVSFTINTAAGATIAGSPIAHQFIRGGAGNDTVNLDGNGGSDTLVYTQLSASSGTGGNGSDTVASFNLDTPFKYLEGRFTFGDVIDISRLLQGFASAGSAATDAANLINQGYVELVQSGGNLLLNVDYDGSAGTAAPSMGTLATLNGLSYASLNETSQVGTLTKMLAQGNLRVAPLQFATETTQLSGGVAGPGNSPGETITLQIQFNQTVHGLNSGSQVGVFTVGGTSVAATWGGVDGTTNRTLTYTIAAGQNGQAAIDEVALKTALEAGLRTGSTAGNAFSYTLNGGAIPNIDSTALPTVGFNAPTLSGTAPSTALVGGGNSVGDTIVLTVTFDGNVNGLTTGTDSAIFKVGGTGVNATWGGTTGTNTRTLTYTVQAGQNGQAAIDEAALKTALIAGISDAAGNAFSYTANAGAIANIDAVPLPMVDTVAPTGGTGMTIASVSAGPLSTITATYTGADLVAGERFQYTTDTGNSWLDVSRTNTSTNTLTIENISTVEARTLQIRAVDTAGSAATLLTQALTGTGSSVSLTDIQALSDLQASLLVEQSGVWFFNQAGSGTGQSGQAVDVYNLLLTKSLAATESTSQDGTANGSNAMTQYVNRVTGTDIVSSDEFAAGFTITGKAAAGQDGTIKFWLDNDRTNSVDEMGTQLQNGVNGVGINYNNTSGDFTISFGANNALLMQASRGVSGSGVHKITVDTDGSGTLNTGEGSRLFLVAAGTASSSDTGLQSQNYSVQDLVTKNVFIYYYGDPDGNGVGIWTEMDSGDTRANAGVNLADRDSSNGSHYSSEKDYYNSNTGQRSVPSGPVDETTAQNTALGYVTAVGAQVWEFQMASSATAAEWTSARSLAGDHTLWRSNTSRLGNLGELLAVYAANFGGDAAGGSVVGAVQPTTDQIAYALNVPGENNTPTGWIAPGWTYGASLTGAIFMSSNSGRIDEVFLGTTLYSPVL